MFPKGVATFTNGSTTVSNISMSIGDIASVARGTRLDLGGIDAPNNILEAIDRSISDNTLELREPFTGATAVYSFKITYTGDGFREAAQAMRDTRETLLNLYVDADTNPTGGSLAIRDVNGNVKTGEPTADDDAVSKSYLQNKLQLTTSDLISGITAASVGTVITTTGFYTAGDTGCGQWKATSTTGLTPSQLPKDLLTPQLVDGSGRLWELLPIPATKRKAYSALALGVVGDGLQNDTNALKAGLFFGDVHGNNITCKITSRIIVTNDKSGLVGSIDLIGSSTAFARTDGAYDNDDGTLLWVSALDFEMSGGVHLKMDDSTPNDNTTCGLVLRESSFSVERCKFSNFKRTKVVRVESCLENCNFNYNQIFDCEMGGSTTSQLTGLDIDDNRPSGSTLSLNVVGNVIKNLTVTTTFEASFGYQTDGINISHPESKGHIIRDNQISFVGEGIDCFGSDCQIVNNIIKDSYVSGVKLVNGATDCMVSNNHVIRPKTYGVVVAGSANVGTPTSGNRIENNHVVSVNPNLDSPTTSFAFGAEDNTGVSLPSDNTFKNNTARDCGNADRIIFNDATPKSNEFIDTKVIGSTPTSIVSNGSGAVITFQDKAYVKAYPTAQDIPSSGATLNLSNVIENMYGELSGGVYTASVPRTVSVFGSIRTGAANAGRTWTLDILKNGSIIERAQAVESISGDLIVRISAPSILLNEGDELSVFVSHNEAASTVITSSSLYSFTISEL